MGNGRRVPAAGGSPRRRHRRGRRCAKNGASARQCGVKSPSSSASRQLRCKASPSPSLQGNYSVVVVSGDSCAERNVLKPNNFCSGEVVEHDGEHSRVAGRPRPPPEAEIEAFFAAAELAERRRFAETYNYDIALDRPLQGRFEWSPVST
uniref:Cyclin-dependent kinase inhibitor domain-containing protein n=1 Tax=Oryza brachyantha TaxID=4533 RepID=J3N9K5_ORYBR